MASWRTPFLDQIDWQLIPAHDAALRCRTADLGRSEHLRGAAQP